MKRDLDLARQLLLDIENRGADCSVSVLRCESQERIGHEGRNGSDGYREETIRYHLRLLIDAQLLKEIDRTAAGIPCVRLTHQGHELLELIRDASQWREALWACQERTGTLSLLLIQDLLRSWANQRMGRSEVGRYRPYPHTGYRYELAGPHPYEAPGAPAQAYHAIPARRPLPSYRWANRAPWDYPEVRYVPVRDTSHGPWRPTEAWNYDENWGPTSREFADRYAGRIHHNEGIDFRTQESDLNRFDSESSQAQRIL